MIQASRKQYLQGLTDKKTIHQTRQNAQSHDCLLTATLLATGCDIHIQNCDCQYFCRLPGP